MADSLFFPAIVVQLSKDQQFLRYAVNFHAALTAIRGKFLCLRLYLPGFLNDRSILKRIALPFQAKRSFSRWRPLKDSNPQPAD